MMGSQDSGKIAGCDMIWSSYTPTGALRDSRELAALAAEILPQLSAGQNATMLAVRGGAIPIGVDWRVEIQLRRFGLIGYSRSGDNAFPLTPLGVHVWNLCSHDGA
jgi:hypothetical protein